VQLVAAGWASQLAKVMLAMHTARFTRGRVRELKNAHNSVIVQNRTRLYELFSSQRPRKSPPAVMT
jgi:hypothetical protein